MVSISLQELSLCKKYCPTTVSFLLMSATIAQEHKVWCGGSGWLSMELRKVHPQT